MGNLVELKTFLSFLAEKCDFNFDIDSFNHRLKLQKYTYLAKYLGWDNNYAYNLYIRGPYCKELADDYYSLYREEVGISQDSLKEFNKKEFCHLVKDKDVSWLEAATTILSVYKNYKHFYSGENLELYVKDKTSEIKSSISPVIIKSAFDDLNRNNILN